MPPKKRKASPDTESRQISPSHSHLPDATEPDIQMSGMQQRPIKRARSRNVTSNSKINAGEASGVDAGFGSQNAVDQSQQYPTHSAIPPNFDPYSDAATQTPDQLPPPLTQRQVKLGRLVQKKKQIIKDSMGREAYNERAERNRKATEESNRHIKEMYRRSLLLPMTPGGIIHRYTSFAHADLTCRDVWSAEHENVGKALQVQFMSKVDEDETFWIWPEPADWDMFEKYPKSGEKALARARDFVAFWLWDYSARRSEYTATRASLNTCFEMFLNGDDAPLYQDYLQKSVNPTITVKEWRSFLEYRSHNTSSPS